MTEKISDQISRMDRIIEWVKACDNKTSIIMTVALLVPTFVIGTDWVLEKLDGLVELVIKACSCSGEGYYFSLLNCTALLLFVATMVLIGISLSKFIKVLIAKTKEKTYGDDIKQDSLVHFNNISKYEKFELFKQAVEKEGDGDYYEDLLSQTYINAKRCAEKFADYNSGIRWLCWALISLVLFVVSLFFIVI